VQEPNNLANRSSFRYTGLVQRKTVGIEFPKDKKGFVLVTKKQKAQGKPNQTYQTTTMKQGGTRRPLNKLRRTLVKGNYRKDLTKV
jgi:large subunit ribosomal protein L28e